MIRLWNLLFYGHYCVHQYEVIEKYNLEGKYIRGGGEFYRVTIISRCTKCGDIKSVQIDK